VAREIIFQFAFTSDSLGDDTADRRCARLAYSPPMARSIASTRF
jgi:hypothetical protein